MAKQKLPTDFEDEASVDATPEALVDEDGTPYCVAHHCRMKQTTGGKAGSTVAHYACPVKDCKCTSKKVKASKSIPREPHKCPRCPEHPVMERNAKLSRATYTILECPACGHKSAPMARPEFVVYHERARGIATAEPVGSR